MVTVPASLHVIYTGLLCFFFFFHILSCMVCIKEQKREDYLSPTSHRALTQTIQNQVSSLFSPSQFQFEVILYQLLLPPTFPYFGPEWTHTYINTQLFGQKPTTASPKLSTGQNRRGEIGATCTHAPWSLQWFPCKSFKCLKNYPINPVKETS